VTLVYPISRLVCCRDSALPPLPIGWLVDRFPRRPIIWLGVTVWSLATAFCGLAQNFGHLLGARLAVGIGEATLSPAAYSMLADLFRPSRLVLAISVMLMGGSIGGGLAVGLGGAVASYAESARALQLPILGVVSSWQYVFLIIGPPGLALSSLIFLVREPQRRDRLGAAPPNISETFRFVRTRRALFTFHFIGFGVQSILTFGVVGWIPAYMGRAFGWSIGQISIPFGLIIGIGSSLGSLAMGWSVDRLFGRGCTDAHMRVNSIIFLGTSIIGVAAFQVHNPWVFLVLVTPIFMTIVFTPSAVAALQIISPNEMRGQMSAMVVLIINGVGLGLGPTVVGAVTDFVFHDETRLGTAVALLFGLLGPIAAAMLALGMKPMREAARLAETWRR